MSNVVKKLKKNFKKIVKAVVIAAVAFAVFPVIAGAMGAGGAAAGAGSMSAAAGSTAAIGGAGSVVAGGAAAAGGGGLISAIGKGAASVGSAIKGASPMVKMGLIQTGGQMIAGAMTPEPQTAAQQQAELLALRHSQPSTAYNFSAQPAGLVSQPSGYQNQFAQPQTQQSNQPRTVARVNPETGLFEQA